MTLLPLDRQFLDGEGGEEGGGQQPEDTEKQAAPVTSRVLPT